MSEETEASEPAARPAEGRNETGAERYDRNLVELMGELRVALPGVQVLFAFLLVAPFNQRFGHASAFERKLYFATLLLTTTSSILLIAPTVMHRLEFRHGLKRHLVRTSNRLTIAGMAVLSLAMTSAVTLITHFLFGQSTAIITAALVLLGFTGVWFLLPLAYLRRHD
jgi:uncharacterized membrane protein YuzA (DUF378 family)